jgi:uncharacterized FAD-dependent dehydrogenase
LPKEAIHVRFPKLTPDIQGADVVVIGAGIAGITDTYMLAKAAKKKYWKMVIYQVEKPTEQLRIQLVAIKNDKSKCLSKRLTLKRDCSKGTREENNCI